MSAPPDVRRWLDDVAELAPTVDLTDRVLQQATTRRRLRFSAVAAACAATIVGASVSVDQLRTEPVDPAGDRANLQYEPEVREPWFGLDDLPDTLDEPIAMALSGYDSGERDSDDRVVTVLGEMYRIPDSGQWTPMVSPDGTVLVWYDDVAQTLVSRHLTDGAERTYAPISSQDAPTFFAEHPEVAQSTRPVLLPSNEAQWSPDGRRLAITADLTMAGPEVAIVLDVVSGTEQVLETEGTTVGWTDADTVFVTRFPQGIDSVPAEFVTVDLDGAVRRVGGADLNPYDGVRDLTLSPDGTTLAAVSAARAEIITLDVGTRAVGTYDGETVPCRACVSNRPTAWASDRELVASQLTPGGGNTVIAVDVDTGAVRQLASISTDMQPRTVTFARDVLRAGPSYSPRS